MHNTLVTESDVTSSMMGEMYRQLASAQLKGRLYKTGYRRTRVAPREVQGGVTGQGTAIAAGCGAVTVCYCYNRNAWTTNTRYISIKNSTKTSKISDGT